MEKNGGREIGEESEGKGEDGPLLLTNIHGRENLEVNMRQESITRREYGTVAKTTNPLKYTIQTGYEYLMPSVERRDWPPGDRWTERTAHKPHPQGFISIYLHKMNVTPMYCNTRLPSLS